MAPVLRHCEVEIPLAPVAEDHAAPMPGKGEPLADAPTRRAVDPCRALSVRGTATSSDPCWNRQGDCRPPGRIRTERALDSPAAGGEPAQHRGPYRAHDNGIGCPPSNTVGDRVMGYLLDGSTRNSSSGDAARREAEPTREFVWVKSAGGLDVGFRERLGSDRARTRPVRRPGWSRDL